MGRALLATIAILSASGCSLALDVLPALVDGGSAIADGGPSGALELADAGARVRAPCGPLDPSRPAETLALARSTTAAIHLVSDTRGNVALLWSTPNDVWSARFDRTQGSWAPPAVVTSTDNPILAIAAPSGAVSGSVAVALLTSSNGGTAIAALRYDLGAGASEPPRTLERWPAGQGRLSALKVAGLGETSIVAWSFDVAGPPITRSVDFAVLRSGRWQLTQGIGSARDLAAAVGGAGDVFLVWSDGQSELGGRIAHGSEGLDDVPLGTPAGAPVLAALEPAGAAIAAWDSDARAVGFRYQSAWQPIALPPVGTAPSILAAAGPAGEALGIWAQGPLLASRFDGTAWSPVLTLAASGTATAAFAIDSGGTGLVVWTRAADGGPPEPVEVHAATLRGDLFTLALTTTATRGVFSVAAAVNDEGTAFAAWSTGRCIVTAIVR
jgi:hypothetical protein